MSLIDVEPLGRRLEGPLLEGLYFPFPRGFAFSFYGRRFPGIWIHGNGLLTLARGEPGFSADYQLFKSTPPLVAPFWADLNPAAAQAPGGIYAMTRDDRVSVTWKDIPGGSHPGRNTFQAVLFASGIIGFAYDSLSLNEALVGMVQNGSVRASLFRYDGVENEPVSLQAFPGRFDGNQLFFEFDGKNYRLNVFETLEIYEGSIRLSRLPAGDRLHFRGEAVIDAGAPEFDPETHHVVVALTGHTLAVIRPGDFQVSNNRLVYHSSTSGATRMTLSFQGCHAHFDFSAEGRDLRGITDPVRVSLALGGSFGSASCLLSGNLHLE